MEPTVLLDQLLPHPTRAQARAEKHSGLRPVPTCPWWPFVWSQQTRVRVGDDGKVPAKSQRQAIDAPPRSNRHPLIAPGRRHLLPPPRSDPKAKPIVLLHCRIF